MGLLTRLANPPLAQEPASNPGPGADFWYEPFGGRSASGYRISIAAAMRVPAIRRAVTVLAGSMASLPLHIYEKTVDGQQRATRNPLDGVVSKRPNADQSAYHFWEGMAAMLILYNHARARIIPGPRGAVDRLVWMAPERVRKIELPSGRAVYEYSERDGTLRRYVQEEVFSIDGLMVGDYDESVLEQGADTIGNLISLTRYVGRQWQNGTRLSGVLEHPSKFESPMAIENLRSSWQRMFAGVENAGKTAVLEEGMKFKELSQKNVDAQLFEQWNFAVEEIGRLFGVPAVLLGHADKTSTYASAEQFFLSFVKHSLMPWLRCIEQAINTQLIIAPDRYFAEFSVQGFMRGDEAARSAFYQSGITAGWLTPNEARALENLNKKDGGDSLYRPLNVEPADAPYRTQEAPQ
jgi:HK97 family phage portal protein